MAPVNPTATSVIPEDTSTPSIESPSTPIPKEAVQPSDTAPIGTQNPIPDIGQQRAGKADLSHVPDGMEKENLPQPLPAFSGEKQSVWEFLSQHVSGMEREAHSCLGKMRLDEDEWAELARNLQRSESDVVQTIILGICDADNCRENFKAILPLLALPLGLKPGQYAYWDFVTVKGLEHGNELVNVALGLTDIEIPENNRGLTPGQLDRIASICDQIAGVKYSTIGLLMQFISSLREATKGVDPETLTKEDIQKAFEKYQPQGDASVLHSGYGDCMCSAELVKSVMENTTYLGSQFSRPITSLIAGKLNLILVTQESPTGRIYLKNAPSRVWGVTHLDVVIPYSDQQGKERVMIYSPGLGRLGSAVQDIDLTKYSFESHSALQRAFVSPGGQSLNAAEYQKIQFGFRSKVVINAVPPEGMDEGAPKDQIFGIDMLKGTFFINSGAAKLVNPKADKGFVVPIRELADNSSGPSALFDSGPWASLRQEGQTNTEAYHSFLDTVGKLFALPPDFADTLIFFAKIYKPYTQAVLWDDIQELIRSQ